jgi:hypothetical protein
MDLPNFCVRICNERIRINAICPGFLHNVVKGGISGFAEVKEHVIKTTNYLLKKSEQIVNGFIFLSCDDSLFASEIYLKLAEATCHCNFLILSSLVSLTKTLALLLFVLPK